MAKKTSISIRATVPVDENIDDVVKGLPNIPSLDNADTLFSYSQSAPQTDLFSGEPEVWLPEGVEPKKPKQEPTPTPEPVPQNEPAPTPVEPTEGVEPQVQLDQPIDPFSHAEPITPPDITDVEHGETLPEAETPKDVQKEANEVFRKMASANDDFSIAFWHGAGEGFKESFWNTVGLFKPELAAEKKRKIAEQTPSIHDYLARGNYTAAAGKFLGYSAGMVAELTAEVLAVAAATSAAEVAGAAGLALGGAAMLRSGALLGYGLRAMRALEKAGALFPAAARQKALEGAAAIAKHITPLTTVAAAKATGETRVEASEQGREFDVADALTSALKTYLAVSGIRSVLPRDMTQEAIEGVAREVAQKWASYFLKDTSRSAAAAAFAGAAYDLVDQLNTKFHLDSDIDFSRILFAGIGSGIVGGLAHAGFHAHELMSTREMVDLIARLQEKPAHTILQGIENDKELLQVLMPHFKEDVFIGEGVVDDKGFVGVLNRHLKEYMKNPEAYREEHPEKAKVLATLIDTSLLKGFLPSKVREAVANEEKVNFSARIEELFRQDTAQLRNELLDEVIKSGKLNSGEPVIKVKLQKRLPPRKVRGEIVNIKGLSGLHFHLDPNGPDFFDTRFGIEEVRYSDGNIYIPLISSALPNVRSGERFTLTLFNDEARIPDIREPVGFNHLEALDLLQKIVGNEINVQMGYEMPSGDYNGAYYHGSRTIEIFKQASTFATTYIHELSHALHAALISVSPEMQLRLWRIVRSKLPADPKKLLLPQFRGDKETVDWISDISEVFATAMEQLAIKKWGGKELHLRLEAMPISTIKILNALDIDYHIQGKELFIRSDEFAKLAKAVYRDSFLKHIENVLQKSLKNLPRFVEVRRKLLSKNVTREGLYGLFEILQSRAIDGVFLPKTAFDNLATIYPWLNDIRKAAGDALFVTISRNKKRIRGVYVTDLLAYVDAMLTPIESRLLDVDLLEFSIGGKVVGYAELANHDYWILHTPHEAFTDDMLSAFSLSLPPGDAATVEIVPTIGKRKSVKVEFGKAAFEEAFKDFVVKQIPEAYPELIRFSRFSRWMLDVHQLAKLNPHIPHFAQLDELTRAWERTKYEAYNDGLELVRLWNELPESDKQEVANLIFDETLLEKPAEHIGENEKGEHVFELNGVEYKLSHKGYTWKRLKDEKFARVLDRMFDALIEREIAKGNEDEVARLEMMREELKKKPYFPLKRFGNYVLLAVDERTGRYIYELYESRFARNRAAKEYQKKGYTVIQDVQGLEHAPYLMLPESIVERVLSDPRLAGDLSPETKEAIREVVVKQTVERGIRAHFVQRKGIPGFSRDIPRILGAYYFAFGHFLARIRHMDELARIANELADAKKHRELYTPTGYITDSEKLSRIIAYVRDHIETLANPRNEAPLFRFATAIYYLGLNLKHALLNFLQLFYAFAVLSARARPTDLAKAINSIGLKGVKDFRDELNAAIELGKREGLLDESLVMEIAGLAHDTDIRTASARSFLRSGLYKLGRLSMYPFHMSEVLGRRAAFKIAYLTFRHGGLGPQDAYVAARETLLDSFFDYSRPYRPLFMRGVGAPITIFFTYLQKMLALLGGIYGRDEARRALGILLALGGISGLPFAQDAMELLDALGSQLSMRPQNAESEARSLLEEAVSTDYADWLWKGALGNLPLFDLSLSFGLGRIAPGVDVLSGGRIERPEDVVGKLATSIGGAGAGMLVNLLYIVPGLQTSDDWWNFYKASPTFLKNLEQAYVHLTRGATRLPNGIYVYMSPTEQAHKYLVALGRVLGLTPRESEEKINEIYNIRSAMLFYDAKRQFLRQRVYNALMAGDMATLKRALDEVERFNELVPPSQKLHISRRELSHAINTRLLRGQFGAERLRILRKLFPDLTPRQLRLLSQPE